VLAFLELVLHVRGAGRRQVKPPLKTGFEYDAILARRMYCFTQRSRVCKRAKRQVNRRARREAKAKLDCEEGNE